MADDIKQMEFGEYETLKDSVDKLTEEVLSKDFIKQEIERLSLSEEQIKKGMIVLQRYHDYLEKHQKKPQYELIVDKYGLLAEKYDSDSDFVKFQKINNFKLTNITPLDHLVIKYFEMDTNPKVFSASKIIFKDFIEHLVETEENNKIKSILNDSMKEGSLVNNLWFFSIDNKNADMFIKYIAIYNAIKFDKTVAIINANDLQRHLKMSKEERNNVLFNLAKVDILSIYNVSFGKKEEWFLEFLLEVFDARIKNQKPVLISSTKEITSIKNEILIKYYYNNSKINDIERTFKGFIRNEFLKIVINN
ncbi:hypothetical protein OF364_00250 [Mycoplasma enhydrae]|uniref:primosome protein n=1 Tax=Mycoplasma enhydrae TaxID=2499220 RepID=UPI00197B448E|nr:primosome protein [Mycoplasma enhydrae]MBN4089447.1 primosome protein [Mycoplasma enhydrae]MCV3753249.1 hypothetical protein [Mycoplasma enhydrae]